MDFIIFTMYDFFNLITEHYTMLIGILAVIGGILSFVGRHPKLAIYIMDHYGQFYLIAKIKWGTYRSKIIGFAIKLINQLRVLYSKLKKSK